MEFVKELVGLINSKEFIDAIYAVLEFFIPGYITIFTFRTLSGYHENTESSESIKIVKCICISFLLQILYFKINISWVRILVQIVTGCILSIVLVLLLRIKKVRWLYSKINHTMISKTVFESIGLHLDDQWVSVFMKDQSMIYGRMIAFGSYGKDPYVAIDCYRTTGSLFDDQTHKVDDQTYKVDEWNRNEDRSINHIITVRYEDILAITLHRNKEEKKNKRKKK